MSRVRILPPGEAERIAAGEVVERPASVARELVENALDAGARRIEVAVDGGGLSRLRVADDGEGMTPEDARLALQRHATSKISCLEDLDRIATLGFRGEALPSIAAVSRLILETAPADGAAVRLVVEAGQVVSEEPAARPRGTTVTVEDLFGNVPARRKFLKTPSGEYGRISDLLLPEMLARPGVGFLLTHDGRVSVDLAPAADRRERLAGLWGRRLASGLAEFDREAGGCRVQGLVSGPGETRGSRRGWHFFVNGRPVRDPMLLHAAGEGMAGALPRGRYPLLYLFLEVPGDRLDVNVHPAKSEVRFADRGLVFSLIRSALAEALSPSRALSRSADLAPEMPAAAGGGSWTVSETASPASETAGRHGSGADPEGGGAPGLFSPGTPAGSPAAEPGPRQTAVDEALPAPVVLAQYRDCFIVAHDAGAFYLLDQHAAHERVLYEEIRALFGRREAHRQALLFPRTVDLEPGQAAGLAEALPVLAELGFGCEAFGEGSLLVREVPDRLPEARAMAALEDMLPLLLAGDTPEADRDGARRRLEHRLAATMACHAAVRLHDGLTRERMQEIVARWSRCREPLTCPHGRSTVVRWPHERILRAFGR